MGKNLKGKTAFIIALLVVFCYGFLGIPRGLTPAALKQALTDHINLGLDLKGGTHLILVVHVEEAVGDTTDRDVQRLQDDLEKAGVSGETVHKLDPAHPETITVSGIPVGKASDARSVMDGNDYSNTYDLVSSSDGSEKLTMKPGAIRSLETATLEHSIETIRARLSPLGVTEPTVQQYGLGDNEVLVELPNISDPGKVEDAIKSQSKLAVYRRGERAVRERPDSNDGAEWNGPAGGPVAAWQHHAELSRRGVSVGAGERGGGNGLPRCSALDRPERASEPHLHADHRGGGPLL